MERKNKGMNGSPTVSVVVPCYNHAEYLNESVASVVAQTFQNWECIIVDDGSTDDTESVARQLSQEDTRIKYLHKTNGGLADARNKGIEAAKGEFILPLDADDKISSNYMEAALRADLRKTSSKSPRGSTGVLSHPPSVKECSGRTACSLCGPANRPPTTASTHCLCAKGQKISAAARATT